MKKQFILNHRTFADLSKNDNITENGIYTYLCLKPLVNNHWSYLHTNVTELNFVLSDVDISNNKSQKDCIKAGLNELEQAGLIKIISNNKYDYKLDLEGMIEEYDKDTPNPYTVFPIDAFRKTLKDCKNKKTIFKCLSGFYYELTHNEITADTDGSEMWFFNVERESLAESCEVSVQSLDKYLRILQENEIIYTYKYNYKYRDSGKQLTNAYGEYKNKDEIDKHCNKYIDDHKDKVYES